MHSMHASIEYIAYYLLMCFCTSNMPNGTINDKLTVIRIATNGTGTTFIITENGVNSARICRITATAIATWKTGCGAFNLFQADS